MAALVNSVPENGAREFEIVFTVADAAFAGRSDPCPVWPIGLPNLKSTLLHITRRMHCAGAVDQLLVLVLQLQEPLALCFRLGGFGKRRSQIGRVHALAQLGKALGFTADGFNIVGHMHAPMSSDRAIAAARGYSAMSGDREMIYGIGRIAINER